MGRSKISALLFGATALALVSASPTMAQQSSDQDTQQQATEQQGGGGDQQAVQQLQQQLDQAAQALDQDDMEGAKQALQQAQQVSRLQACLLSHRRCAQLTAQPDERLISHPTTPPQNMSDLTQ